MFDDGLKVFFLNVIYGLIPVIIVWVGLWITLGSSTVANSTRNNSGMGYQLFLPASAVNTEAWLVIIIATIIGFLIGLILYMALTNMALYDGKLKAAFRFSEILERISMIGWGKYIAWYLVMLFIGFAASIVSVLLMLPLFIGFIIVPLIIAPYFAMFGARSLALLFISGEDGAFDA